MKNSYLIILIILILGTRMSFSQDGVFKFKKIDLSFKEINQKDSLLSLELYQNGIYSKSKAYQSKSKYDSLIKLYSLQYSYNGVGGGRSDNRLRCPLLFVKLNFITENNEEYFQLIPIVLKICVTSQEYEIKVLDIDLNELIVQTDKMILISENNTYEIVAKEKMMINKLLKIE